MGSNQDAGDTMGDRILSGVRRVHAGYNRIEMRVRAYTPWIVNKLEVLIGLGLFAGLVYWLYLFSAA